MQKIALSSRAREAVQERTASLAQRPCADQKLDAVGNRSIVGYGRGVLIVCRQPDEYDQSTTREVGCRRAGKTAT